MDEITESTASMNAEETGLLSGKVGIAIFFGYLYLAKKNVHYIQMVEANLDRVVDDMETKPLAGTFSIGLTGIAWSIQHLQNIGVLGHEWNDFLADLDTYVDMNCQQNLELESFDLLHGFMGNGVYYLESMSRRNNEGRLSEIVKRIWETRKQMASLESWPQRKIYGEHKGKFVLNLGLAHGLPSILGFAAETFSLGIAPTKSEAIIRSIVATLNMLPQENTLSYFPSEILLDELPEVLDGKKTQESRLGWCHGDMGIAVALFKAGKALEETSWQQKTIEIMERAANRSLQNSGLQDVGFCHGVASVVHIFARFYEWTGLATFRQASHSWLENIRQFQDHSLSASCGFQFRLIDPNNSEGVILGANWSLLEGISGLGLVLLPFVYDIQPTWDGIFLTKTTHYMAK